MSSLITRDLLLAALGLFVPPFPVMVKCGVFSAQTLINFVLSVLGGIPGVIHCWYIVVSYPEDGIPFLNSARGNYELVPDAEEAGVRAQRRSRHRHDSQHESQPESHSPEDSAHDSDAPGPSAPQGPQPPPSYGTVVGDNKVQYQ